MEGGRQKDILYIVIFVFSLAIKVFAQRPYISVTFNHSFKDLQINILSFQKGGV